MGGRLDATNVVKAPLVSVITNIDFDHKQFLGHSLVKIAGEKAAIIKRGGILITAASQPAVLALIRRKCREINSKFWPVGKPAETPALKLGLPGDYQRINAACAVAVIKGLRQRGLPVTEKAVRRGLAKAFWPGRFETLGGNILLDGAHNPAGARALAKSLRSKLGPGRKLVLVFGVLKDKDYREMIKIMASIAAKVILVKPVSERALAPERMLAGWRQAAGAENVSLAAGMALALGRARAAAGKNGLVVVSGSLYAVGEARKLLLKEKRGGKKNG
jgi:dihydrofolate synthase/folylpolyglutamate synthase